MWTLTLTDESGKIVKKRTFKVRKDALRYFDSEAYNGGCTNSLIDEALAKLRGGSVRQSLAIDDGQLTVFRT